MDIPVEPQETSHIRAYMVGGILALIIIGFIVAVLIGKSGGDYGVEATVSPSVSAEATPSLAVQPPFDLPLTVPPGFSINYFAKDLGKPRAMIFDSQGTMLVSIPTKGQILALPDDNGDGVADREVVVAAGLNLPHGMDFLCTDSCRLFVAETDKLESFAYDAEKMLATDKTLIAPLPGGGEHITRSVIVVPDGDTYYLLVSIGSSCNVCVESNALRAGISKVTLDGKVTRYAYGLRNAVFLVRDLVHKRIVATEMGRDYIGDDLPPDEINIIEANKDYGWPNCYGKNIHDTAFDKNTYIRNPCSQPFETESWIDLPAHSAPLGLRVIDNQKLPSEYQGDVLVSLHGSSQRKPPNGDKVILVRTDKNGKYLASEDFITGWVNDKDVKVGRPVDIQIDKNGVIYVSDDKLGVIYRVTYDGKTPGKPKPVKETSACIRTGCGGQICSDEEVVSTCEYRAEYACYDSAGCERQASGQCGWTQTSALQQCISEARTVR